MNKKLFFTLTFFLLIASLFLRPSSAQALNIYLDKSISNINVGDSILMKVFIDTEGKEINSLEGTLQVNGGVKISEVNTGGSVFDLWPEKPQILNNQEISFTGGTEGGIYGKDLRLFNFVITPTNIGDITIGLKGINAYLNDGKGTKLAGNNDVFKIKVIKQNVDKNKDIVSMLSEKDKVPPLSFSIELGHDEFLFDGKYFITFNAVDSISGINKYQVKEGDLSYVDSDNTYVLKDQSLKSKIFVKAIDNAGNERVEILNLKQGLTIFQILRDILIALLIFTIANILRKFIKRKK